MFHRKKESDFLNSLLHYKKYFNKEIDVKHLAKVYYYKVIYKTSFFGWDVDLSPLKDTQKAIIIEAPHTSNWDFFIGIYAGLKLKLPFKFIIKNSWNMPIIGLILKGLGAIFIDRATSSGLTKELGYQMEKIKNGYLVFTPEGTRSRVNKWKTGFYHIAKNSKLPIAMAYIDYKTKKIGIHKIFYPTNNMQQDFNNIKEFYKTISAKKPQNFNKNWDI